MSRSFNFRESPLNEEQEFQDLEEMKGKLKATFESHINSNWNAETRLAGAALAASAYTEAVQAQLALESYMPSGSCVNRSEEMNILEGMKGQLKEKFADHIESTWNAETRTVGVQASLACARIVQIQLALSR